jgi:hypothetical protein
MAGSGQSQLDNHVDVRRVLDLLVFEPVRYLTGFFS